jgi:hypothetical protein
MPRRTLFSAVVVGAALGLVTADRTLAGEQYNAGMKVISSDATDARLVQLGLNKSVVIELSRDIKKVLIAGGQGGQVRVSIQLPLMSSCCRDDVSPSSGRLSVARMSISTMLMTGKSAR